jgi:hypothetical protein
MVHYFAAYNVINKRGGKIWNKVWYYIRTRVEFRSLLSTRTYIQFRLKNFRVTAVRAKSAFQ